MKANTQVSAYAYYCQYKQVHSFGVTVSINRYTVLGLHITVSINRYTVLGLGARVSGFGVRG
jgi:hypothetical protein